MVKTILVIIKILLQIEVMFKSLIVSFKALSHTSNLQHPTPANAVVENCELVLQSIHNLYLRNPLNHSTL